MSTVRSSHVVRITVNGTDVVLPLSATRFIGSWRRSHVHPIVAPEPAVAGVLERGDTFSTVVDLGQLLLAAPTPRLATARLVTVTSGAATLTLMAEAVHEPVAADPRAEDERGGAEAWRVPARFVAGGVRAGAEGLLPLLDLTAVLAAVTRTSSDG